MNWHASCPWHFEETILRLCWLWVRSRSSEVTRSKRSNCWFWTLGTIMHVFRSRFFIKNARKWPYDIFFPIKIGEKWKIEKSSQCVEMPCKVAVFSIQKALQGSFLKISTSNLAHIFIELVSITYIFRFLKILEIFGEYDKNSKFSSSNLTQFSKFWTHLKIWDSSLIARFMCESFDM